MRPVIEGVRLVFSRKDSRSVVVTFTLLLMLLVLLVQNGKAAFEILSLTSLPLTATSTLFLSTLFAVRDTLTTSTLILAVIGSLLGGINIALAYTYFKVRGDALFAGGFYSGLGLAAAILGIGCAACGTAILSLVLGFFGLSFVLVLLPYNGEEIAYVGIALLLFATYSLAKKVVAPNVC